MALELPAELEPVLGLLGVEWPQVNEDELNRFADELRKFASAIDSTQMAADKAVSALGQVYHGASADQLAQAWSAISKFSELVVQGCGLVANAVSAAAIVVEMCKGGAIAQLAVTSGGLATAAATAPWTTPAVLATGKQIVSQILESAVTELGHALAQPVADLVDTAVKAVTGGASAGAGGSAGQGFGVDLAKLASTALQLRGHADDVNSSGSAFLQIFDSMDLGQPGEIIGKVVTEAAEQIATTVGTEVLKRLLSSFTGTADNMDQIGKNLSQNEDEHSRLMSNLLSAPTPVAALTPGRLAGTSTLSTDSAAGPSASHTGIDSLRPRLGTTNAGGYDGTDGGTDGGDGTVNAGQPGTQPSVVLQQSESPTSHSLPTAPVQSGTTNPGSTGTRSSADAPGEEHPTATTAGSPAAGAANNTYGRTGKSNGRSTNTGTTGTGTGTGSRPIQDLGVQGRAKRAKAEEDEERARAEHRPAELPDGLPAELPTEEAVEAGR